MSLALDLEERLLQLGHQNASGPGGGRGARAPRRPAARSARRRRPRTRPWPPGTRCRAGPRPGRSRCRPRARGRHGDGWSCRSRHGRPSGSASNLPLSAGSRSSGSLRGRGIGGRQHRRCHRRDERSRPPGIPRQLRVRGVDPPTRGAGAGGAVVRRSSVCGDAAGCTLTRGGATVDLAAMGAGAVARRTIGSKRASGAEPTAGAAPARAVAGWRPGTWPDPCPEPCPAPCR